VHEDDPIERYRERVHGEAENRQALVDTRLAVQLDPSVARNDEDELQAEIGRRLYAIGGWDGVLPSGLELCPYCGEVRDRHPGGERSVCLCGGVACRYCAAGRTRRPISDYYDPADHRLWHVPYFGQGVGCRWCGALRRRLAPAADTKWGSIAPDVSALFEPIREAAEALSRG